MVLDANEIASGLWQGSVPPQGGVLNLLGYHALVLAAEEFQFDAGFYPGVAVIYAPNDDNGKPLSREQLTIAVKAARDVAARIRSGQKVLVTCAAGVNRSGLVSALTLHFLYGWSGDRCIRRIRERRTHPNFGKALSNPFFTHALRKLPESRPTPTPGPIILLR